MVEQNTRGWRRLIQGDGLERQIQVWSGAEYWGMVWSGILGHVKAE